MEVHAKIIFLHATASTTAITPLATILDRKRITLHTTILFARAILQIQAAIRMVPTTQQVTYLATQTISAQASSLTMVTINTSMVETTDKVAVTAHNKPFLLAAVLGIKHR